MIALSPSRGIFNKFATGSRRRCAGCWPVAKKRGYSAGERQHVGPRRTDGPAGQRAVPGMDRPAMFARSGAPPADFGFRIHAGGRDKSRDRSSLHVIGSFRSRLRRLRTANMNCRPRETGSGNRTSGEFVKRPFGLHSFRRWTFGPIELVGPQPLVATTGSLFTNAPVVPLEGQESKFIFPTVTPELKRDVKGTRTLTVSKSSMRNSS